MDYIPWSEYYKKWEGKKPLNEIIANYNLWHFQYEMHLHSLWLNSGTYNGENEEENSISFLVVGAYRDDDEGSDAGAVYVFDATDLSATPTKLVPSELDASDYFGYSVAATSTQIIVGAYRDDDEDSNAGAVYVYDATDLSATPTKLTPSVLDVSDYFGVSVAATNNQIIVGAYRDDYERDLPGAAYVFDATDLSATPTKLVPSELDDDFRFGYSVAATSTQIIVGALWDNDGGSNAGAVYVYDATDLSATPTKLTPFELDAGDEFGVSVAATSTQIIVGAYRDDDEGSSAGAVYVYDATDLSATPTKLVPSELDAFDSFGVSVAATSTQIIVGAYLDDDEDFNAGAVYVYDATDLSAPPTKLVPSELDAGDQFGISVAATNNQIIVGTNKDDDHGTDAGAIYVFDATDLSATPTKLTPFELDAGDEFGISVAATSTQII